MRRISRYRGNPYIHLYLKVLTGRYDVNKCRDIANDSNSLQEHVH